MVAAAAMLLANGTARAEPALLIRDVTVIDPATRTIMAHRDVAIESGHILAVSATSAAPAQKTIDGRGKYLIPGLFDMHVHTAIASLHERTLTLLLANGVTGVRDMFSDCRDPAEDEMCIDAMRQSQAEIEAGTRVGPRLLSLASPKLQSGGPTDPKDPRAIWYANDAKSAVAAIDHAAARKPDMIKVAEMPVGAYHALMAEARKRRLVVGGHIPWGISVAEAAQAGQHSIEHARDLPVDCSTYGAKMRAEARLIPDGAKLKQFYAGLTDREAQTVATYSPRLCKTQIAAMVRHGTYYVPTHLTREMDYRTVEPAYRADPRMAFIPESEKAVWTEDLDKMAAVGPDVIAGRKALFDEGLKLTGQAFHAGVKIMAGTDTNDTMIFPGFSLHDELGMLVRAGLSPMDALRAATAVPAEYLHRQSDLGELRKGRIADLVLLDANPIADIANTRRIDTVILGGKVYGRAALDAMIQSQRVDRPK